MKYIDEYKNPIAAKAIVKQIKSLSERLNRDKFNIMEVCGSHTMAIARYGIRTILPNNIHLISGPGCPVCVTDAGYIDSAIELAKKGNIIATFGDMLNVPGSYSSLRESRAEGADIRVCYSPLATLEIAHNNPDKEIIFLAIGFETTIASFVGLIKIIEENNIKNISLLTSFKLVPPALEALASDKELEIDGFLLPAHVSVIIGEKSYIKFVEKYKIPSVIASFEPLDILYGIEGILKQAANKKAFVDNRYKRAVNPEGNIIAKRLIDRYLEPYDAIWRGIGIIPKSGLKLKTVYSKYDASAKFGIEIKKGKHNPKCKCGEVLKGKISPDKCPLFAKYCNPLHPIGPCMVSSEGSCAAFYKYIR